MSFLGDYTVGDTINFKFTTRQFSTGAPFALAGTPSLAAYEDESVTQITAGFTLTADFDSVTGMNHVTLVATGANGFEAGKDYDVVIAAGTVDSVSVVGEVVGRFTLGRSAAAVDLANATDGLGAIKAETAAILVDTGTTLDGRIPAALVGGRMDADVGAISTDATAADNAEAFFDGTGYAGTGNVIPTVTTLTGHTAQTGDSFARIGVAGVGLTDIQLPADGFDLIQGLSGLVRSTAAAGCTTTSIVTNLTEATNDHYNGRIITFTSGALAGQATDITDYVGSTKTLTVTALTEAPASTDAFVIS